MHYLYIETSSTNNGFSPLFKIESVVIYEFIPLWTPLTKIDWYVFVRLIQAYVGYLKPKDIVGFYLPYPVYLSGQPSRYWPGSTQLIFGDRTRFNAFIAIWHYALWQAFLEEENRRSWKGL